MRSVLVVARPGARVLFLSAVAALLCLALAAGSASAGKGVVSVFGASGAAEGQFSNAAGTAVNQTTGDVYVVDQGDNRVEQFGADGSFIRTWGFGVADGGSAFETCASSCQAGIAGSGDGQFDGPVGIAVDQADGSVYVLDVNNSRVEKFDSSGAFVSQFGAAGSGDGQFSSPQGLAVDPTDRSVYVADTGDHRVERFDSSGVYQSQLGSEGSGDGQFEGPTRVAVDSTGKLYVLDAGNARIERFTSAGVFDQVFDPTDVFAPSEIAIGPGNDDLYVGQWAQDFSEQRVVEIAAAGTLAATHGVGSGASNVSGLALSAGAQRIYLADGFNARVFVLDDLTAPTVSIDPPAGVTSSSVSLSGAVNPNGPPAVGWRFETSTDDASWTPAAADQDAGSGTSDVPVAQALAGLLPAQAYFVRLVATRPFNAPAISSEVQFTTTAIAPGVRTDPANDIAPTHATLQGVINPHNASTTYYFEYGATTGYGTSIPASQDAALTPSNVQQLAGNGVAQRLDGLQPGTTYHYRLVAHNQAGTIQGQDQAFTTTTTPAPSTPRAGISGTGFLPSGRGWEQVSPSAKHGNDVMADSGRTRAAADGAAAMFTSLGGFGDVRGAGVATEYMGVRDGQPGTSGWTTHAITPPQAPLTVRAATFSMDPLYEGDLSPDLSQGVFRAWSPITNAPGVAHVENLYLRNDLRSPGSGFYQLLSDCLACGSTPLSPIASTIQMPRLAGASADFSHLIFESVYQLTPDAPPSGSRPKLYEWDHGTLRLAGVLPDGSAAPLSVAGQSAWWTTYTPRTISADGSRIFFVDNSGTGGGQTGVLYMRVDHATTVQIDASERTDCADHDPCNGTPEPDPSGPSPSTYWNSSADGSRVFFTSAHALTDDAPSGTVHLYMYDTTAAAGHHLTLLSVDRERSDGVNGAQGVIGTSDDGHFVYFIAGGQLLAGEPVTNEPGIYLWHDGALSYVGELADPSTDTNGDLYGKWNLRTFGARVTPDGRHLLFTSHTGVGLTGYDHGSCHGPVGCAELYLYSADSRQTRCVSCNPSGAPATADAVINERVRTSGATTTWHLGHALPDDGRHVFFTTAEALVPGDANGKQDVYEYDVPSGTLHLLSSGRDPADSYFMDASPSGNDVFLLSRQPLVGWDTDQNYDLYDARVGGGFPDPAPAPAQCLGDPCRGAPSGAPPAVAPGSAGFHGAGNVTNAPSSKRAAKPLKCKRGSVRKRVKGRVRCVKRKRHVAKKTRHARSQRRRGK